MSAVLIISIFLLVVTSFAILRSKRSSSDVEASSQLPPPPRRGLFDTAAVGGPVGDSPTHPDAEARRRYANGLRERAAAGDLTSLDDAHLSADADLYREVLAALSRHYRDDAGKLCELASHISGRRELRADSSFAEALLAAWKASPDLISVADMLRIAALSDDATVYQRAVEAVLEYWEDGRLPEFTAEALGRLFESEYWLLGASAKRSGAGFVLKETLGGVRRRLSAAGPRRVIHNNEAGF